MITEPGQMLYHMVYLDESQGRSSRRNVPEDGQYKCPTPNCNKSFKYKGGVRHHLRFGCQTNVKSFKCPNEGCGRLFKYRESLNDHLRYVCQVEAHFKCAYCDYITWYPNNVLKHCRRMHPSSNAEYVDLSRTNPLQSNHKN